MGNKTLIIAVVNNAYVEGEVVPNMLDLFLEGLWVGEGTRELVKHLMIVAVDQSAYDRCIFGGLHCYRLVTDDGLDFMGEQLAKTHGFISLMWRRTLFLLEVLERGYNFIFTDVDMIWLRNPFTILTTNTTQDLDIQFSLDSKNTTFTINRVNTGFYYVKSNNKTISLFKKWYDMKDMSRNRVKDQDILQLLTWQGVFTDLDINVRFLETELFSGFCHNNFDFRFVFTVHANCRLDIRVKVADLVQVLRDWNSFNVTRSNS
ncbi:hypothetical protein RND81_02G104800 [Saponaria officinalis]|uniref:Nucleotide-diphospho-sugar transferase domain-containing protein n=1 Tax=Saponaria officinalis TaxID=3572 RepID=A0AAW1MSX6_SAPOF